MVYGVHLATEAMGPELLKEVVRFHKRQANADLIAERALEADPTVRCRLVCGALVSRLSFHQPLCHCCCAIGDGRRRPVGGYLEHVVQAFHAQPHEHRGILGRNIATCGT